MRFHRQISLLAIALSVATAACANVTSFAPPEYLNWLDELKADMAKRGISKETLDTVYAQDFYHPEPDVVKKDRQQAEFVLTSTEYVNRLVNKKRVTEGQKRYQDLKPLLNKLEKEYGVQGNYLIAFWGVETNYGSNFGGYNAIDALTTLSYDKRRPTFFRNQLYEALKIIDTWHIDHTKMQGSWAGAMGHFQFIPTTLAQYGTDGNGDGHIDIIHSVGDAMFSAGNYLHRLGWNPNEKIIRRVSLPADFDLSLLDGKTKKTLSAWAAMGVLNDDGTPIPVADMTAGLVADVAAITDARAAAQNAPTHDPNAIDTDVAPQPVIYAYLTYPNFYRIKKWNSSNWYAIAIATLADELK